jgi:hypothetical protein
MVESMELKDKVSVELHHELGNLAEQIEGEFIITKVN